MSKKYKQYRQGVFRPKNKKKCQNKDPVIYRSGLELKFMQILDNNQNVEKWGSEIIFVPYIKPTNNRWARYFVDFYVELYINGELKKFLFEIKPQRQVVLQEHGNAKESTKQYARIMFAINTAKWNAAKKWCEDRKKKYNEDISFIIITEVNIDTILHSKL